jgi:hypothetical protein
MGRLRIASLACACRLLLACGGDAAQTDAAPPDATPRPDVDTGPDIRDQIAGIPGVTIVGGSQIGSIHFFQLTFHQPADHAQPDGPGFEQRLTLIHRDTAAPTVLGLSGYYVWEDFFEEEPTAILLANQIEVEHRFFAPSRPEPADWSLLTIRQAADDDHAIVEAFKTIYPAAWISTGASKGGMTATYFRRFYPDDVDGTVAYVAPISFGAPDDRYLPFFDAVGDPTCRAAVRDFQREVLLRRPAMRTRMDGEAAASGWTYDRIGVEIAFESAVIDLEWAFWQYWGATSCANLPSAAATDDDVWGFFNTINGPNFYSDSMTAYYEPYYYQAADELGYPSVPRAHLEDLLVAAPVDNIADVIPPGSMPSYDPAVMQDISDWVMSQGSELLFIYGQWDPWTGGAYTLGGAADSLLLVAPEGTHAAGIYALSAADRAVAVDALGRWTSTTPSGKPTSARPAPGWRPPPPRRLRPLP